MQGSSLSSGTHSLEEGGEAGDGGVCQRSPRLLPCSEIHWNCQLAAVLRAKLYYSEIVRIHCRIDPEYVRPGVPHQPALPKALALFFLSGSYRLLLSYSVLLIDILGINLTLTFYYLPLTTGHLHLKFVYIVFNKPCLPHF